MALRVGILRSLHYSIDEIADVLSISRESVRKYSARFYSEMTMTPEMAMRTTLAWSHFLVVGWDRAVSGAGIYRGGDAA